MPNFARIIAYKLKSKKKGISQIKTEDMPS
jgi:hypothetical protein